MNNRNSSRHIHIHVIQNDLSRILVTGESIRCWSCSSDMDPSCRDYFNTTYFAFGRSNYASQGYETGIRPSTAPYLQQCPEGGNVYLYDQKAVCVKKKQTCK